MGHQGGVAGRIVVVAAGLLLASCDGGDSAGAPSGPACVTGRSFDSTWDGIQAVVFEKHGCTQQVCHGSAAQAGLDLRPDVAYENLLAGSSQSANPRVYPGDKDRSFLYSKLAAATQPGSVAVAGSPMPSGLPALSADELELVRLWIYSGAPREGTVIGTAELLDACLPEPKPLTIEPLPAPAPGEGVQIVMPNWELEANSEHEVCFASWFDISDQVPDEYKDPTGQFFRWDETELRQDPQSHHLILSYLSLTEEDIHHPGFGEWTCKGGERAGQACEPRERGACGDGLCATTPRDTFACIGYGPPGARTSSFQIGGAQQAQQAVSFYPGVFAQIPMKGFLLWNSHAFNLTNSSHLMNGRLNYRFAREQEHPVRPLFDGTKIFAANAEPYTTQTVCHDSVLPRGARLFNLSSHTHKRGKLFTVDLADGTRVYESRVYNDPTEARFDPPLAFDSADPARRTLHFCSLYNNGVKDDGSPDPETVTRASRVPASARQTLGRCEPIACAGGRVGDACDGSDDDGSCDSSPGAGDGDCDACRITGGESTENEMFILIGQYYVEGERLAATATAGAGRSGFTGVAVPSAPGCGAGSHAAHAAAGGGDATVGHSGHGGHGG